MEHLATLKEIADYFRRPGVESLKDFRDQWVALSEKDKEDLKAGLGNGSLTY